MKHFISGFVAQCKKHSLRAELIVVDWNPPSDKPILEQALEIPLDTDPCIIRFIQVPKSVHDRFENADRLPLFQMIAKNVGIRRAEGKFVLATNIDILFSDELMIFLRDNLKEGFLYRTDRHDVPEEIPSGSIENILKFCKSNTFRIHGYKGSLILRDGRWVKGIKETKKNFFNIFKIQVEPEYTIFKNEIKKTKRKFRKKLNLKWLQLISCLENGKRMIRETISNRQIVYKNMVRFLAVSVLYLFLNFAKGLLKTANTLYSIVLILYALTFTSFLLVFAATRKIVLGPFFVLEEKIRMIFFRSKRKTSLLSFLPRLHTNACGDFTLMSKKDWKNVRGYPEWPMYSWHIDSVLVYQAMLHDIYHKKCENTQRIYHIEHETGSGFSPEKPEALFERLNKSKIPCLDNVQLKKIIDQMQTQKIGKTLPLFNNEKWGLKDVL